MGRRGKFALVVTGRVRSRLPLATALLVAAMAAVPSAASSAPASSAFLTGPSSKTPVAIVVGT